MRPIVKVLLVLGVVVLAVGVVWFASRKWTSAPAPAPAQEAKRPADQRPSYNDPLATLERWRQILPGHPSEQPAPPARRPDRLRSSAEHEGTVVAHRSETPVAGADPPGPVLRPTGVEGEVVTTRWREREPAAGAGNTYTIVQGDTLYGIAMKHYGDPRCAALIESANPGLNARALKVGERILLPERRPPEAAAPAGGTPAAPATPPGKVYVVQRNDTLIGIARRFYGDAAAYKKIYEANKDILSSPNATLPVGQKLRLPER
jgi:nucleoid-associated protein YgaU